MQRDVEPPQGAERPGIRAGRSAGPPEGRAEAALDAAEAFLARFVVWPSEHARVAATLWVAHTYLIESFD